MSRISVPKGAANFRGRKSNSLMNLCGKTKNCLQLYRWGFCSEFVPLVVVLNIIFIGGLPLVSVDSIPSGLNPLV